MPTEPPPSRPPVPAGLDVAVGWTWRLLVLAAGVGVLGLLVQRLALVVGAFLAGVLLTALLQPAAAGLTRRGLPHALSATLVFLGFLTALGLGLYVLGGALVEQLQGLAERLSGGVADLQDLVVDSGLPITPADVEVLAGRFTDALADGDAAGGALTLAGLVGDLLSGLLLALFVLLVLLLDGSRVWRWTVTRLPRSGQARTDEAGHAAWHTFVGYLRGISLVAAVDASLIALALLLLDVPFVLPLAGLTFLAAFVPYVGASVAGSVAAAVALVDGGVVTALAVVAAVLVVQTVDGYVLEPLVVGKAVDLHPLAVVLAISVGGVLAGVGGAVVAVPLTAGLNTFAVHLARSAPDQPLAARTG